MANTFGASPFQNRSGHDSISIRSGKVYHLLKSYLRISRILAIVQRNLSRKLPKRLIQPIQPEIMTASRLIIWRDHR